MIKNDPVHAFLGGREGKDGKAVTLRIPCTYCGKPLGDDKSKRKYTFYCNDICRKSYMTQIEEIKNNPLRKN